MFLHVENKGGELDAAPLALMEEGLPMTLLEVMAIGTPAIGTNVGEATKIIQTIRREY